MIIENEVLSKRKSIKIIKDIKEIIYNFASRAGVTTRLSLFYITIILFRILHTIVTHRKIVMYILIVPPQYTKIGFIYV